MDYITEIKNYLLFLRKNCNLEISLHPHGNESLISDSELISFNIHENEYCAYIKSFPGLQQRCVDRQRSVMKNCVPQGICETCYAGVREYVYPILKDGNTVGIICVSGYKGFESSAASSTDILCLPHAELKKAYGSLKSDMPGKAYTDTLVIPLIRMLELAYSKADDTAKEPDGVEKVIRYVNRYYDRNITLSHICKELYCSRSSISHSFRKATGMTFREYLVSVRLRAAKSMLCHSDLSITRISSAVGFNDSNYFSSVFRANEGVSPGRYRKDNSGKYYKKNGI